jgi:hypothetical protein
MTASGFGEADLAVFRGTLSAGAASRYVFGAIATNGESISDKGRFDTLSRDLTDGDEVVADDTAWKEMEFDVAVAGLRRCCCCCCCCLLLLPLLLGFLLPSGLYSLKSPQSTRNRYDLLETYSPQAVSSTAAASPLRYWACANNAITFLLFPLARERREDDSSRSSELSIAVVVELY